MNESVRAIVEDPVPLYKDIDVDFATRSLIEEVSLIILGISVTHYLVTSFFRRTLRPG